jgi:hypothetical protein
MFTVAAGKHEKWPPSHRKEMQRHTENKKGSLLTRYIKRADKS